MLLRSMQNTTKELADKAFENDALRDEQSAAGRRRLHIKAGSLSVSVKLPPPPAWIMQPPPLADTAERDYFTLREADSLCKNNWKEPRSILMSSADELPISMAPMCNLLC